MAYGVSGFRVSQQSYNHGNLATSGALSWDGAYDGLGSALRSTSYGKIYFACQGDNVWRDLLVGNDFKGVIEIQGSDAASSDYARWSIRFTSPAYGVSNYSQDQYSDGGWNTGTFALQLVNVGNSHVLQFRYSSYYSSSNNGGFQLVVRNM